MLVSTKELARDVVVVAASAGGFELVLMLAAAFTPDLPAGVAIVLHRGAHDGSLLALVQHRSRMRVVEPANQETFEHGTIYLAPANHHMMLEKGYFRLGVGPKERFTRPAADPLFRSAAAAYGPRVLGVVLSGGDADGVDGCQAIAAAGGITIAQDPAQARVPSMPGNTILHDHVDAVLPIAGIIDAIVALALGRPFEA